MDLGPTWCCEPLPRKLVQIDEVRPVPMRLDRRRSAGISVDESLVDVLSDFVATRSDARSDVRDEILRGKVHCTHDVFEDSAREPTPASVSDPRAPARAIAEQHRQAVGRHHRANLARTARYDSIGLR